MFRNRRFGRHYFVPCVVCNFSAIVFDYGKKIEVVPCLCVKNKKGKK